ncbi:hypothetical protein HK097_001566 [Rhizophlyctis rosea]|uniref:Oxidoreductase n=1 Tax=Rhizophlyctis rosea TaxID=64517 RepID=A0AAD5X7E1_9FUNG|nr:hypothetical protein HK097_001566 [Rhizophlyctis rosea]
MAPIKVGIIGYGFSTKCFHLPFIRPNSDLQVYAFLQRAATPADVKSPWGHCTVEFPQAKHYTTPDQFFADAEIELVVICTHEHEEFARRALESGKHVVVEKPFVTTSEAAERLIQLARKQNRVLTAFHNRRFDSDFRTLQHLVSQNALGDIREAELHYDFPNPGWIGGWTGKYTPGEGMAFGLGTHTVDQALTLFGTPTSVTGFLRANRDNAGESDIDDSFTIILQYGGDKKKLLVTVKTTIVSNLKDQLKFFVRGTEGSFIKFGTDPQEAKAIASPGQPALSPTFGDELPAAWGTLTTITQFDASQSLDSDSKKWIGKYPSLPGWYRGYYEGVVAAIKGEKEVYVKAETAGDGLKVIELARRSAEEGVTLKWE